MGKEQAGVANVGVVNGEAGGEELEWCELGFDEADGRACMSLGGLCMSKYNFGETGG